MVARNIVTVEVLGSIPTGHLLSGVEQLVARLAHNQKVVGSNPTPATHSPVAQW